MIASARQGECSIVVIHFLMELSDSEESESECKGLNRTRQNINLVVLKARVTDPVFLKGYCTYELHPYLEEP